MSKNRNSSAAGGRSQRQLRVGEELRHQLAEIFARGEFRDPALTDATITVTEVAISPDLKNATAYIMPLGGQDEQDILAALIRARSFIRTQIARSSTLRYTPQVRFRLDDTFDRSSHIDTLLRDPKVVRDLHEDEYSEDDDGAPT